MDLVGVADQLAVELEDLRPAPRVPEPVLCDGRQSVSSLHHVDVERFPSLRAHDPVRTQVPLSLELLDAFLGVRAEDPVDVHKVIRPRLEGVLQPLHLLTPRALLERRKLRHAPSLPLPDDPVAEY